MIQTVYTILILYSWIVTAVLLVFLLLIGRFYELKFGQKSHYRLFLVPLGLFLVAAVWYAFFPANSVGALGRDFVGLFWPDLMLLIGGIVLSWLCFSLYKTMMGAKR